MEYSLVEDLILSRKDGRISNLNFYVNSSVTSIYPDYDVDSLNSPEMKYLFTTCNLIKLELDKQIVNSNKVTQLELHIKNKYSLHIDVHELRHVYQVAIYKLAK